MTMVYEDQWRRKFQWFPRLTSDSKHFVWLEHVLARQWGEYEQVRLLGYKEVE